MRSAHLGVLAVIAAGKMARKVQQQRQIIFRNTQAPGDILMLTAAIRDLHRCYPGQFVTGVETTAKEIWQNNPYITSLSHKRVKEFRLGYPLIHKSNQCGLHFIQGFIDDLNAKLKLNVRLTEFRPDLHWSKAELNEPLIEGDYWVVLSGGKADFTTKWWEISRYQEVVTRLKDKITFVQLGNKPSGGGARHYHPPLSGVVNMVGRTNLREAFRICLHARGVLTPITCFMHVAAAIGKPTIVIAGGREHYTWEAYTLETLKRNMAFSSGIAKTPLVELSQWDSWSPQNDIKFVNHAFEPHEYMHSVGKLECCKSGGCWKTKVAEGKPEQNCKDVIRRPGRVPLPRCMDLITVDKVVDKILEIESRIGKEGYKVSAVKDLIVKLPGIDKAPPQQDVNPIIAGDKAKGSVVSPIVADKMFIPAKKLKFRQLSFPITVFSLTYGDHAKLALRCLEGLYGHTDSSLFKLRYGLNEVIPSARKKILNFLKKQNNVEAVYEANPQIYKYPMMRRMFHDPAKPINTKWLLWLDDDSHLTDPNWISSLGDKVDEMFLQQDARYPKGYHCYGKVYYFHFRGNQWEWMKKADWYTGKPHNVDHSKKPPMDKSDFCTGGFWLVTDEAIKTCNWPDERIKHRGGDIMLGAALQQQGYGVTQAFHGVRISDAKQRGYNEAVAGIE